MQDRLIKLLSDGEFHSGEELGKALGVSRTAIWKQLKHLEDYGLAVESIKGRGYRIGSPINLLDKNEILASVSPSIRSSLDDLCVLMVTDSTNSQVMQRLATESGCYVCTAEQQTVGRGRRGRVWHSPFGGNLYFSISWCFQGGAAALEGLSLAVGVAICRALDENGCDAVQLKWPNDLVSNGKKLGGVLLEMTGDAEGPCAVVVGVGLNVCMGPVEPIDQPWTDLVTVSPVVSYNRNVLLAAMISHLIAMLRGYESEGFASYRREWERRDAFLGQAVSLRMGDEQACGIERGVANDGALKVETASGMQVFRGGEVSLRGAASDT